MDAGILLNVSGRQTGVSIEYSTAKPSFPSRNAVIVDKMPARVFEKTYSFIPMRPITFLMFPYKKSS